MIHIGLRIKKLEIVRNWHIFSKKLLMNPDLKPVLFKQIKPDFMIGMKLI